MTSEELLGVLGDLDGEIIQEALEDESNLGKNKKRFTIGILKYTKQMKGATLLVASLALCIVGILVYQNHNKGLLATELFETSLETGRSQEEAASGTMDGVMAGSAEAETDEGTDLLLQYSIYDIYLKSDFSWELESVVPMSNTRLPILEDAKIEKSDQLLSTLPWDQYHKYALRNDKTLSLTLAKEYLEKGYVLVHNTPLDSDEAQKVSEDFKEYDGVVIVYLYNEQTGYDLPYYRFYKKLDENNYAVVSVPAIQIQDYEELFQE